MNFPRFNKPPDEVKKTPYREISIFDTGTFNIHSKTVTSFGDEWKHFHQFDQRDIQSLGDLYFDIVDSSMLNSAHSVLEVGCGSGRFMKYIGSRAGSITGIDPSEAIFAADKLIGNDPRVRLAIASASRLPFEDESFDFVYSIGVLHHIPDTAKAMKDCVSKLKPGGHFMVYLYYDFDNRNVFYKLIFQVARVLRFFVSKLPKLLKKFASDVLAILLYMPFVMVCRFLKLIGVPERTRKMIPLQFYENMSFYVIRNDSLDRFGTPLEQRFSKEQIKSMMEDCKLSEIIFSDNAPYWHAVGKKSRNETA